MRHRDNYVAQDDPMTALREDFAALKQDFADLIGGKKERLREQVHTVMDSASERTRTGLGSINEKLDAQRDKIADCAAERPLTMILVTLAIGAVVGKLMFWLLRR